MSQDTYYESAKGDFCIIVSDKPSGTAETISLTMMFNEESDGVPKHYYGSYFGADGQPYLTDGKARNGRVQSITLEKQKDGVYKTPKHSPLFALLSALKDTSDVRFYTKSEDKGFLRKNTLSDQTLKFEA